MSSPRESALTIDDHRAASEEFLLLDEQQMPEKDRQEILESIEQVAAHNRIPAGDNVFKITPLKRGFVFPLIINLLAVIAVAGGFVGANIYFSRQQATISSQAGTFFSAEGKLIAQVKKESAAKLKAKDQEISTVKAKLAKLDQESAALKANMQATISAKEIQLKQQMQTQLTAEKARLKKLGFSQTQITSRLKTFEQQKNNEYAKQLDQYRKQSEAAIKQKEQEIQAQQQQTRQALATANQERQKILTQAQQRENQLRAKYTAQTQQLKQANQQLEAKSTAAQQKLNALAAKAQSEQLMSDQIIGSYNAILQDIQQANYDQAKKDIASLRGLLDSQSVAAIPSLANHRPVDLRLLTSLEELIAARTQPGRPAVDPSVVKRANEVAAATKLVDEAKAAHGQGKSAEAESLYGKAIAQVPIVHEAYAALQAIFQAKQTDQLRTRDATIAALEQEVAKKSAQVTALDRQLAGVQQQLTAAKGSLASLQQRVTSQDATIAGLKQESATSTATIASLRKRITEQDVNLADLTQALNQANATVGDLRTQLASGGNQASALKQQLAEAQAAAAAAERKAAAQQETATAEQTQVILQQGTVGKLEQQLAANEQQIATLRTQLSSAQKRVTTLQGNVAGIFDTFASLQNDYGNLRGQIAGLISSGTPQDIQKARDLLLKFIGGSGVDHILPGFSTVNKEVDTSLSKASETKGKSAGRAQALNEVMKVTTYFNTSGGSSSSAAEKAVIDKAAAQDPLFRQAAAGIQRLAQKSGKAAGHQALAVQSQLIGTVSYVGAKTLTVEKLVSISVADGASVVIAHKGANGSEVPIAEGTVQKNASDRVEVTVKRLLNSGTSPQLLDVVYLRSQSGG